jgi:hypothetical protein
MVNSNGHDVVFPFAINNGYHERIESSSYRLSNLGRTVAGITYKTG